MSPLRRAIIIPGVVLLAGFVVVMRWRRASSAGASIGQAASGVPVPANEFAERLGALERLRDTGILAPEEYVSRVAELRQVASRDARGAQFARRIGQ